jgi:hypothetical protein
MPSMMKQKFKNTVKHLMIVPSIILGLLCVVSVATAQKTTTPPKQQITDIMLNKRNANEVIQRTLADWGSEMLAAGSSSADYAKLSSRYTLLYSLNEMIVINDKLNVSKCIEEAGRLIWTEKVISDEAAYNVAMNEVKALLLKKNNPNYKE